MIAELTFALYALAAVVWTIGVIRRRDAMSGFATFACAAALACNVAFIGMRWRQAGHFPASGLYESLFFFTFMLTLANFMVLLQFRVQLLGALGSALAAVMTALAIFRASSEVRELPAALRSYWFPLHVTAYFVGYGTMGAAFVSAIVQIARPELKTSRGLAIDRLCYRLCAFGFPFLTIGLTSGALWAKSAWGRYWGWDPKETLGLITWLAYLIYLHLPLAFPKLRKRPEILSAILIAAFCAVIFTFIGAGGLPDSTKSMHVYSVSGRDFFYAAVALTVLCLVYVFYRVSIRKSKDTSKQEDRKPADRTNPGDDNGKD
ncbi:MAG TPA: cytochrome c biogenesis protein CcsA [Candidatus Brocadiia bacterium]|nr:cytochrome c biogenesis protein CcsA [Candidatus Brocadiia bacterium]